MYTLLAALTTLCIPPALSRLQVKLMTDDRQWEVKSYRLPLDEWTRVDISWTEEGGLELYRDGIQSVTDPVGTAMSRLDVSHHCHGNQIYVNVV